MYKEFCSSLICLDLKDATLVKNFALKLIPLGEYSHVQRIFASSRLTSDFVQCLTAHHHYHESEIIEKIDFDVPILYFVPCSVLQVMLAMLLYLLFSCSRPLVDRSILAWPWIHRV